MGVVDQQRDRPVGDDPPASLICVITYGHEAESLEPTLSPAIRLASETPSISVIVVDDCSGSAPEGLSVPTFVTPANSGYAAAVNYVATEIASVRTQRIVFVNPDAIVSHETLKKLCGPDYASSPVVVPQATSDGIVAENVRELYRWQDALAQVVAGGWRQQRCRPIADVAVHEMMGSPWVPAGTVVSFDAQFIKTNLLNPNMFWLEMSALAMDLSYPCRFTVLPDTFTHIGDSTRSHANDTVNASLLWARRSYAIRYGPAWARSAFTTLAAVGLLGRVIFRRLKVSSALTQYNVARGRVAWQNLR